MAFGGEESPQEPLRLLLDQEFEAARGSGARIGCAVRGRIGNRGPGGRFGEGRHASSGSGAEHPGDEYTELPEMEPI